MAPPDGSSLADHAADETTPLLIASQAGPTTQANEELPPEYTNGHLNAPDLSKPSPSSTPPIQESDDIDTPLPKLQITLLCYSALVEPIAYFSIFPFINQMLSETDSIREADIGFYSGLIESLFSLVQMLLMIFYGRLADRIGRKPILIFSLSGIAIASSLFGLSKTLAQMIAFRCAAGLFAGSVVTVRAMITENCTASTQARAFSFYAFTRNLGIFLGPLIGGALSKPADQYPKFFGHNHFLKEYPYALPTIFTGAVACSAMLLSLFFLKETLPPRHQPPTSSSSADPTTKPTNPPSLRTLLTSTASIPAVLAIYTHVMLLGLAFTAIQPVFLFTSPHLGGFGFTIAEISLFLALAGASQAAWILLAFPPLQRRYSTGWVLRACSYAWPVFFACFPLGNLLLRAASSPHSWSKVAFWVIVPLNNILGVGVSMAFTCVQLALNDVSPGPQSLGTLNGVALTLNSGIRAVAPAVFASVFATGVRLGWLRGHLVWVVLVLLALGLYVVVRWLPAKAEGRVARKGREREAEQQDDGQER